MSDAREIVQPRWKRRATEIADAIGGGTSSVTLSSQSIIDIKQAFKEALYGTSEEQLAAGYQYCNSMMEVNLRSHPLSHMQQGGHLLVNTSDHPSDPGRFKPIAVTGNTLGLTGLPANATALPVQLMGIDASTGLVNPSLAGTPALRVNVMNQNAIQTSVAGHVQVKPAVDPSNSNNIFPLRVEVDQLPRYTNGNTKPVPIMSGSNFAGSVQELKVREQNLAGTAGNGIKITETAPVTSVSVSGTVAVNNHPPAVTTVSVDNHPTPVTTVSVDNHPTTTTITGTVAVQPALDANNVAIPLSVTETNPVSGGGGGGVQQVKIVGDETYGIIMTKIAQTTATRLSQYASVDYGTVGRTQNYQPNLSIANGDNLNTGWIIRSNGVDIYHQDITLGIVDDSGTVDLNLIQIPVTTTVVNGQLTVDKYHGRKVTLSSVANVWIVEPGQDFVQDVNIAAQAANLRVSEYPTTYQNPAQFGTVTASSGAGLGAHTVTRSDGTVTSSENVHFNGSWYNVVPIGSTVVSGSVTGTNGHWSVIQMDEL